jgi:hypothetical protein
MSSQAQRYAQKNRIYMADDTAKYIVIVELTIQAREVSLNLFEFPDGSVLRTDPEREALIVVSAPSA